MALVKCKECGTGVSETGKTCPRCGAKVSKKTSLVTWSVLLFIIFIGYSVIQAQAVPSPTNHNINKNTSIAKPSWTTSSSRNEMTGKFSAYALSQEVYPIKKMSFPYGDVEASMVIGCDSESEWAYFVFNKNPNLAGTKTEDGYNVINTRIRWNNEIKAVVLSQEWGSNFISFRDDSAAIHRMSASDTALLELQWHGEKPAYFEFSLNGSSKALAEIRSKCAQNG